MLMEKTSFMTIEEFREYVVSELEESFIGKCTTYKQQYEYILKYYNITYDKLCIMILNNAKSILNDEKFAKLYNDDISRLDSFIYAFGELLDENYLNECISDVYTQRFNYVLYKSGIITEEHLSYEL